MPPYILNVDGTDYLMEVSAWAGETLSSATQMTICKGSQNQGRALHVNWRYQEDGQSKWHQLVLSRAIGFSLLYDARQFPFGSHAEQLVVHHKDHVHENMLIANLQVETRSDHRAHHNRR